MTKEQRICSDGKSVNYLWAVMKDADFSGVTMDKKEAAEFLRHFSKVGCIQYSDHCLKRMVYRNQRDAGYDSESGGVDNPPYMTAIIRLLNRATGRIQSALILRSSKSIQIIKIVLILPSVRQYILRAVSQCWTFYDAIKFKLEKKAHYMNIFLYDSFYQAGRVNQADPTANWGISFRKEKSVHLIIVQDVGLDSHITAFFRGGW